MAIRFPADFCGEFFMRQTDTQQFLAFSGNERENLSQKVF